MKHTVTYTTVNGATTAGTTFDLFRWATDEVVLAWSNELFGWSWDSNATTGTITRAARDYSLPVIFSSFETANEFCRLLDQDAQSSVYGTLTVDGWQLKCAATAGEVTRISGGLVLCKLTLGALDPTWRRYTLHHLTSGDISGIETTGLDYSTDHSFDYAGSSLAALFANFQMTTDSLLRITFWGACNNPYVRVTSTSASGLATTNVYGVNDSCKNSYERIIIDPTGRRSLGGSIYKLGAYGERTNLYDKRRRGTAGSGSYVFERMPAGHLSVSWPQNFEVDVEAIEERGMLPWS